MNKQTKPISVFANGAEARAYWESHDFIEHLDWAKAKKVSLPSLMPTTKTIYPRLPQHLLDPSKVSSNARGMPRQSLVRVSLHKKLRTP